MLSMGGIVPGDRPWPNERRRPRGRRTHARPLGIVLAMTARELFDAAARRESVTTFGNPLAAHAPAIDRLNVHPVPDGDTGTNLARTTAAVVEETAAAAADLAPTCAAVDGTPLPEPDLSAGAVAALLAELVTPGRELVTVVSGEGSSAASTHALQAWLAEHRPAVEVEVHHGGQPLYPYLFGVE